MAKKATREGRIEQAKDKMTHAYYVLCDVRQLLVNAGFDTSKNKGERLSLELLDEMIGRSQLVLIPAGIDLFPEDAGVEFPAALPAEAPPW